MIGSIFVGVIFLAVIIGAVAGLPFFSRRLSLRANVVIILGYLSILVILSLSSFAIPPWALQQPVDPDISLTGFQNSDTVIADGIRNGTFEAPEGCLKTVNAFDISIDSIAVSHHDGLPGLVYVGTKGVDAPDNGNGKIDVLTYVDGYVYFNGNYYDYSIEPPAVSIDNSDFYISGIEKKTLHLIQFNDRTILPQFFDEAETSHSFGAHSYLIVVILLPPGIDATGDITPLAELGQPIA